MHYVGLIILGFIIGMWTGVCFNGHYIDTIQNTFCTQIYKNTKNYQKCLGTPTLKVIKELKYIDE